MQSPDRIYDSTAVPAEGNISRSAWHSLSRLSDSALRLSRSESPSSQRAPRSF